MEWKNTKTLENLMRAFAGETQAWARYTFAEQGARTQGYANLAELFRITAGQEKEHAEVLWDLLKSAGEAVVSAPGDYPVDLQGDVLSLLRQAVRYERKEAEEVYPAFARTAEAEGFGPVAGRFHALAAIERLHAARFARFAEALEQGTLFRAEAPVQWLCLNCGHVVTAAEPPQACPVCSHAQGWFLRLELSPFQ